MYIEKYWGNYIGGSDDSLTLLGYFMDKGESELTLGEIFKDHGLDKLNWDFTTSDELGFIDSEGLEYDFYYAIDLVTDLAALILECSVNESFTPAELMGDEDDISIRLILSDDEKKELNDALKNFVNNPMDYDIQEMMDEEELREMATEIEELRKDLFE